MSGRLTMSFDDYLLMLADGCMHGLGGGPRNSDFRVATKSLHNEELGRELHILEIVGRLVKDEETGLFYTTESEIEARRDVDEIEQKMREALFQRAGVDDLVTVRPDAISWVRKMVESATGHVLARCKNLVCYPFLELEVERIKRRLDLYEARLVELEQKQSVRIAA